MLSSAVSTVPLPGPLSRPPEWDLALWYAAGMTRAVNVQNHKDRR